MPGDLDAIIHTPARLRIMAALAASPEGSLLEFKRLRALLGLTDGNLGAHIATLGGAGYVAVTKDFEGKRPRTRIAVTKAGYTAYLAHVAALRAILDGGDVG
ncbi:transcriptional regulator [Methylobacterium nonmethylotrophicum]|uniref:Transcriptional regulator n=1 Tax=Methylobacterium nonmethylotrophicum TaxID=1141884 RepID=A0A4Z0NRS6_9HYPH|nr:transcriptional regulator [Methylobacterium nonmethylotrophicum]TGD99118.1 transcriptional regulator [Methylobacterium nonmethylotrophicum]